MSKLRNVLTIRGKFNPTNESQRFCLMIMLVFCQLHSFCQEKPDTMLVPCQAEHKFRARQLIVPATLLATGSVGVATLSWRQSVKKNVGKWSKGRHVTIGNTNIEDFVQYLPVATNLFLGCTGVQAKHRLGERVLITATAYLAEATLVNATKYIVRERRPYNYPHGPRNSFPSGHTATAFTGAELVRLEYGWKAGIPAYAVATFAGFMRIYHEKHWFNDVLAGAGAGILSANIANWLYPVERKWFRPKKQRSDTAILLVPSFETVTNSPTLSFSAVF